ncbi:hypothetical protein BHM03_00054894 [Ensete ventricosum]|nr:hypothetical protein BHM03_00054894 [Ensete ventricosum]
MCVKDEIGEVSEVTEKFLSCDAAVGRSSSFANSTTNRSENRSENTVAIDDVNPVTDFVPIIRSGEWSDIGSRSYMEDTHICISDLAKKFGCRSLEGEAMSFYGVSNYKMSKDHKPSCANERKRIESLGGFIVDDAYLNGELAVTRALGDWGFEGLKEIDQPGGLLIAEPELKKIMLTKEDEFLLIGSDGIWDVFSNQNAIDFARRQLQEHNDATACCKELVQEAMKRGAMDNLTIVMVCFHMDPPPARIMQRRRRTISAKGFHTLSDILKEKSSITN